MQPAPAFVSSCRALLPTLAAGALALGLLAPTAQARTAHGGPSSRATAPTAAPAALAQPSPDLPGLPAIAPELASVPVDSPALRRARAAYDRLASLHEAHQRRRVATDRRLGDLTAGLRRAQGSLVGARASAAAAQARLSALDGAIAELAIRIYATGGSSARIDAALAAPQPAINEADRRDVLAMASMDVLLAERRRARSDLDDANRRIAAANAESDAIREEQITLRTARPHLIADEVAAAPPVAVQRVAYEDARVLARVEGVEFPLVALDAYVRAATTTSRDDPQCGLRWWAIAGISRVEGRHGTYGGASLTEAGDTTKRIIGIQLNGTNLTRVVMDTDGGALDGDAEYDRAVGPMQFIPQTWRRFAVDGNGDGLATPFNLYDATRAAAGYLCRASRGLHDDAGLRAAYFAYNRSAAYVEHVLSYARHYERAVTVPGSAD